MTISEEIRHQLIVLSRKPKAQSTLFTRRAPIDWPPGDVTNPNSPLHDGRFTDTTVWELIASQLEQGCSVEEVTLTRPPGATAYVMQFHLESDERPVYVKVQLGAGKIIGRSFHYSEHKG